MKANFKVNKLKAKRNERGMNFGVIPKRFKIEYLK